MDLYKNEITKSFLEKFGGSFYFMLPDGILVYDSNENIFILDGEKDTIETMKESLEIGSNLLFLKNQLNYQGILL